MRTERRRTRASPETHERPAGRAHNGPLVVHARESVQHVRATVRRHGHRQVPAAAARDALKDKTSSVRRSALGLLERLIFIHPFEWCLSSETEWKEKYKEASDTLEKMEARLGRRPRSTRRTKRKRKGVKGDHDEECEGEEDGQAGVEIGRAHV